MKRPPQRLPFLLGVTLLLLPGVTPAADRQGVTHDQVAGWLEGYEEAWETLDPDKAAALFTEDATYLENPYADPYQGRQGIREYWATVTSDQQDVDFTYEILAVSGNTGIAHWHSEFTQKSSGSGVILDGVFVLEFTPEGLCRSLKEWWHVQVDAPEQQ